MVLPLLAALAPALIGGGISAIGALMAPKPEPTVQTNSIDLARLRADAEASGFNPLTIIRGGGLSGYGRSEMSAGPDMRLSNAFQAFGSSIASASWDPYGAARSKAEIGLMEAQIGDFARRGSAPSGMSFNVPKAKITNGDVRTLAGWDGTPVRVGPAAKAQDFEDEYGDLAGSGYGIMRFGMDAWSKAYTDVKSVSWGPNGWKVDPKGTPSKTFTGGGF